MSESRKLIQILQLCCIFWVTLMSCFFLTYGVQPAKLRFAVCDVGQGDAILLRYDALTILMDAGPNSQVLQCLQAELSPLRRHIDILVLSHLDADHVAGVESVLTRYSVGEVWWNGEHEPSASRLKSLEFLQTAGVPLIVPPVGSTFRAPGLLMTAVWNAARALEVSELSLEENPNAQSLGVYIMGESFGFLSLGDLECAQELAVARSLLLKKIPFLKASHHGSKTSSCLEFLHEIQTEVAFLSLGRNNSYNHPGENVLKNLASRRIRVFRTDEWGTLTWTRATHAWNWSSSKAQKEGE